MDEKNEASQTPTPVGRPPQRTALALPDWFKQMVLEKRQPTPEDRERLSLWFQQQLAGSPLDPENFRPKEEQDV